jgi:predicted dehydrogenase
LAIHPTAQWSYNRISAPDFLLKTLDRRRAARHDGALPATHLPHLRRPEMHQAISRRNFLAGSLAAGFSFSILPAGLARGYAANEKLNLALVGCGGRGSWFAGLIPRMNQNMVALCDVNQQRAAVAFRDFPGTPKYTDFRQMLDERADELDGVIVATPDNTHAVITMAAIEAGKAVYCEKPLTHDVLEARAVRLAAAEKGVVTQMGNQGTASRELRVGVDAIRAGLLGTIQEVHAYVSGGSGERPVPADSEPVPDYLDWDLWLGPAAERPFHTQWLQWHQWRDFATGNLGNWASHSANLAFMALRIHELWHQPPGDPAPRIRLTPEVSDQTQQGFPRWARLTYDIPPRGELPRVPFTVHVGGPSTQEVFQRVHQAGVSDQPSAAGTERFTSHAGCFIVGTAGQLYAIAHNTRITLLPREKYGDLSDVPRELPDSRGHEHEWMDAIRGGPPALSHFDYSGPLTEFLMLGNVATLLNRPLEYDPVAGVCVGDPQATKLLLRDYRPGWSL